MSKSDLYLKINNMYAGRAGIKRGETKFSSQLATVRSVSTFSATSDFTIPLQVEGRLISSGQYKDHSLGNLVIEGDELLKSLDRWAGVMIFKSHKTFESISKGEDPSIDDVVGRIIKVVWNPIEKAIDYFAEIYDKNVAMKIASGLIQFVSVGFAREIKKIKDSIFKAFNIEPKEVSLVFNPRDKSASIKPTGT